MATYAFAGGVSGTKAYGQQSKIRFVGTWANGDSWTVPIVSTLSGDLTLGKGNIAGQSFFSGFKLKDRMYVGFSSSFAMSQIGDVEQWEQQNPGAAVISFLSQFGPQDTVTAFASFEGKLVVFGSLSTQIWQIDADPSQFVLLQTLDNTGTTEPLSVKSIGDLDVLHLDSSGVRSIKTKEINGNAYVDDVGTAIDSLISAAKRAWDLAHFVYFPSLYDGAQVPAIVEPFSKQYWISFDSTTYVLSTHPQSKIKAWSTFKNTAEVVGGSMTVPATYDVAGAASVALALNSTWYVWTPGANDLAATLNGTTAITSGVPFQTSAVGNQILSLTGTPSAAITATLTCLATPFSPIKHIAYNGRVYTRTQTGLIYRYSGSGATATFDRTIANVELPWLDLDSPGTRKQAVAGEASIKGYWTLYGSLNPKTAPPYSQIFARGNTTTPTTTADSTFDDPGVFGLSGNGTHVKFQAISGPYATEAKLCKLVFKFQKSQG